MLSLFQSFFGREKIIAFFYILFLLAVLLYTYTQIDLGLAVSRNEQLQSIVRNFQQIGYFQRPLSTNLYISFVIISFAFYNIILAGVHAKKLSRHFIWFVFCVTAGILTVSYTAFSYDIFNYIFDAKIITQYHANPYFHKALDFPSDPMLGFMHWTHRVYPYGPLWLLVTTPLSFVGFGYFLPTYFLFKLLTTASYLGSIWYLEKTLNKIMPQKTLFGIVFFGLNPLIIVESLITNHIDSVMTVFCLAATYYLLQKKGVLATILFFLSVGIKFVTGFLFPIFFYALFKQKKHGITHWNSYFFFFFLTMIIGVVIETQHGTFQPWYLIPVIAYGAFFSTSYVVFLPVYVITFFALFTYVPFLFSGNWNPPIPRMLNDLYFFSYTFAFFVTVMYFFSNQIRLWRKKMKHEKK